METLNYIAELWGTSIVIFSFALLLKEGHLSRLFTAMEKEENSFLWGTITAVLGLAMILANNTWGSTLEIVITVLGWLTLLKGLFFLFMPQMIRKCIEKMKSSPYIPYAIIAALIVGLAITYLGFTA